MKREFLDLIKCPYCGSDFRLLKIYKQRKEDIINGYIGCGCSQFPILEGILNLKLGSLNSYITKSLIKGKTRKAIALSLLKYTKDIGLMILLESKGIAGKGLAKILLGSIKARANCVYRSYSNKRSPFYDLLGNDPFGTYLKHRFSSETFWPIYPFMPLLEENKNRILDLGCGAGHASFVISNHAKPRHLVCADYLFSNLYLAKKYFAPDAEFVCLDANHPLPFKDDIFSSVVMQDAFHSLPGHALLASEMERILFPHGFLLLLHLHNSLKYNLASGKPLSPSRWVALFKRLTVKPLVERNLIEDFILKNRLDLAKNYSNEELDSSNAIAIVGTKVGSFLRTYEHVERDFLSHKENLIINPIYGILRDRDRIVLQRRFPSKLFKGEYPLSEKYLPEKYIINGKLSKIIRDEVLDTTSKEISEKDLQHIEDLMRKFILINVPRNYC